jgi:hypothetical protein
MSGPISAVSRRGSSTRTPLTAVSNSSMKRSNADRCTRMRERAQQSCPALSNTPYGAVAAAFSRSAVREDDVGALAAELERHALDLACGPGHDRSPTSVAAGEHHLAHVRVVDEPLAHDRALARDHCEHALGQARLERELAEAHGRQRRELGRLQHDGVARRERRREAPAGDGHGEVPRDDDPDDAERLLEGDVDAAGTGICDAEAGAPAPRRSSPARRGRCSPPTGRCRACAPSCATSSCASSSTWSSDDVGEAPAGAGAISPAPRPATRGGPLPRVAMRASSPRPRSREPRR